MLVHETKIPNKAELFTYLNDGQPSTQALSQLVTPATSNLLFRRLGHFSLDNNIQSGFQSRELKTVHLNVSCQYFKIVLHKNYENPHNNFNQVGLIKLQFHGTYIGDYEANLLSNMTS